MRTIKFRGKRVNRNNEWSYGDLRQINGECFVFPQTYDAACDRDKVYPDTVGQFTGRLDKNGKEIYEGDILIEPSIFDLPRTVFWDHRFMRYGNISPSTCGYIALHDYSKPEIIGNIHDNPELLTNEY